MRHSKLILFLLLTFILGAMFSCRKDDSFFEGNAKYRMSTDTLLFDTVFTSIGSATRYVKVYNDEEQPILVNISLSNGSNSFFRLNADGFTGEKLNAVEIQAKDSIYIFVEVTINPDNPLSISPFVVEEFLIVKSAESEIKTLLMAFGQNANYIPKANEKGLISSLCSDFNTVTWNDPKPYVIYGILVIDSCQLVLPPGTNVYVHGGIVVKPDFIYNEGQIIVLEHGTLIAQGTIERPVKIEGDRLESEYNDEPGQWVGLRLLEGSKNNVLDHIIIRNSVVGIQVDSACELKISNSIIENTVSSGIYAKHGKVYGENLLIHSNGGNALSLIYGGDYEFNYSTLASYTDKNEAVVVTNFNCIDPPFCTQTLYSPVAFRMTNCIISGGSEDELFFGDIRKKENDPVSFVYEIQNCIVRVDSLINANNYPNFFDHCKDCINLKRTDFNELNELFFNKDENIYTLDTMSVARMKGKHLPNITMDISGKPRKSMLSDLGCYEFD